MEGILCGKTRKPFEWVQGTPFFFFDHTYQNKKEPMNKAPAKSSSFVTALQAAGYGFASLYLVKCNQQGVPWAGVPAVITTGLFAVKSLQLVSGFQEFLLARRRFQMFKAAAESHAKGRQAILEELRKAGLLNKQGLFLGAYRDERGKEHDVTYDGQNACLLLGPPEAGKTTSSLITSLLPIAGKQGNGIGHAVVLNDPNGEGYAITKDALLAAGCRLVILCPFHRELAAKLGIEIKDDGLNLWSGLRLDDDPATVRSVIVDIAAMLITIGPRDDAKDKFFKRGGRKLCEFLQAYCVVLRKIPTPSMLYELVALGPAGIIDLCQQVMTNEATMGHSLVKQAASVHGYATTASDQFAGYLGCCEEALRLYDAEGVFGEHFTPEGFDPRSIKDDPNTVVFVMYPTQKASSHQAPLNLTFSHITEQLAADPRPSRRVSLLIDETAGAGQLPLTRWVSEYRKFGIRCVLCFQELAGQAERLYGAYTVKEILAACEVIWASNVREPSTLEMLSKKTGETVIDDRSMNDPTRFDPQAGDRQTFGRSHKTRPVKRQDDIRRMDTTQALVIAGNLHAFDVRRVPYWTREAWNAITGPNPYRQQEDSDVA